MWISGRCDSWIPVFVKAQILHQRQPKESLLTDLAEIWGRCCQAACCHGVCHRHTPQRTHVAPTFQGDEGFDSHTIPDLNAIKYPNIPVDARVCIHVTQICTHTLFKTVWRFLILMILVNLDHYPKCNEYIYIYIKSLSAKYQKWVVALLN